MGWVVLAVFVFMVLVVIGSFQVSADQKAMAAMNEHIQRLPGFNPAVRYDNPSMAILIDPDSNQFAIALKTGSARAYRFDQLVAVDVEHDGSSLEKTNRGSQAMGAAVGGVLLGPVGLLLGGLTGSKRKVALVKRLSLKIFTNDLEKPVTEVVFFHSPSGAKPDAPVVKSAASQLEGWYGRFRTILQANERAPSSPASPTESASAQTERAAGFGKRRGLVVPG